MFPNIQPVKMVSKVKVDSHLPMENKNSLFELI